jgi:hypothetical protein
VFIGSIFFEKFSSQLDKKTRQGTLERRKKRNEEQSLEV